MHSMTWNERYRDKKIETAQHLLQDQIREWTERLTAQVCALACEAPGFAGIPNKDKIECAVWDMLTEEVFADEISNAQTVLADNNCSDDSIFKPEAVKLRDATFWKQFKERTAADKLRPVPTNPQTHADLGKPL
jgi:hypothetical protein